MKKITLLFLFLAAGLSAYAKKWTITNSGFTFNPETITITQGDTVIFQIASIHRVAEVSEVTWNANDNSPLSGGFSTPSGGGTILPDKLKEGTHFYVCVPHASGGMKGTIIVQGTTSVDDHPTSSFLSVYPNPSNGRIQIDLGKDLRIEKYQVDIFDVNGKRIYTSSITPQHLEREIDLSNLNNGMYFLTISSGNKVDRKKIIIQ